MFPAPQRGERLRRLVTALQRAPYRPSLVPRQSVEDQVSTDLSGQSSTDYLTSIEFTLDRPLETFDEGRFMQALQKATGVTSTKARIVSIRQGSTIVELGGESDALEEIIQRFRDSQRTLHEFAKATGVTRISWDSDGQKFDLQIESQLEPILLKARTDDIQVEDVADSVDIGIMTIREDEFLAVLDRFPNRQTVVGGRRFYEFSVNTTRTGSDIGVAIVRFPEQGQGIAHAVARDLIDELNPGWLFLVGVGGGIPDTEYSLGDVVVATRLNDFSVSAALQGEQSEYNVSGGAMHQDVEALLAHLPSFKTQLSGWNHQKSIRMKKPSVEIPEDLQSPLLYGSEAWRRKVQESLRANFPQGKRRRSPKVRTAPTISSDALIKDATLAEQWQKAARHTEAVEMELGGVYLAARHGGARDYRILAIRGLSDIVGFKRSGEWTKYACHSAAALAHALVMSGVIHSCAGPDVSST